MEKKEKYRVAVVGATGAVGKEMISVPTAECDQGEVVEHPVIRIDIVGDTLFRRRLCTDAALFVTPRYVETVTFVGQGTSFTCTPDIVGDIKMLAGNHLAEDTVLRVRTTEGGIVIEAVGERTDIGT